jgi:hypothetical protein
MDEAAVFTSAANAPSTISMPVTTTLTSVFPWLVSASSTSGGARSSSLAEEFAIFADEASDWAELTLSAALETWPDE